MECATDTDKYRKSNIDEVKGQGPKDKGKRLSSRLEKGLRGCERGLRIMVQEPELNAKS
jgi:hypothetical protein